MTSAATTHDTNHNTSPAVAVPPAPTGRARRAQVANGRPRHTTGVTRLVRRLERERRRYARPAGPEWPTEQAWRAGICEGLRLAQIAIRKGV